MLGENYDICIIGSGPAGLTLAAELLNSGKKICVIESGGFTKSAHADSLREVKNSGEIVVKTGSRERVVGGISSVWTGISAPMDEIDMERWPFGLSELKPYYERAEAYGFPKFERFATRPETKFPRLEEKRFIARIPPWNFGKELGHIFKNPNLTLLTDSTVTGLVSNGSTVTHINVRKSDGTTQSISAKKFVIAAGGIESPRLLLMSKLGNEHDQVGRYLMNHPKKALGFFYFNKPTKNIPYVIRETEAGWSEYLGLRIKEDLQRTLGLLNSYLRFEEILTFRQKILKKIFPGISLAIKKVRIWNFMEIEPRPENRLTLGDTLDANGKLIPVIKLDTSSHDRRSMIELHPILGEEMEKALVGRLESPLLTRTEPWPIITDASHHIGGTIMGNDPRTSVVDRNLKVHSVGNLYICSSSVFPTSGNANPTYTIVALAIRLAELLRKI